MPPTAALTNRVPGFTPGTSSAQILKLRDEHIPVPDGGQMEPQALQAWAQLTRAAIAAEANELAVSLNDPDADIASVREEIDRPGGNLFNISIDLALLLSQCEDALADAGAGANDRPAITQLRKTIESLRKKFDVTPPPAKDDQAEAAVSQPDGHAAVGGQ